MPDDRLRRFEFAVEMLDRVEDEDYLKRVCFTDEAIFHLSGQVNKHNVRVWGSENPHVVREQVRDSPKVNVWCGVLHNKVIGPFFCGKEYHSKRLPRHVGAVRRTSTSGLSAIYRVPTRWCTATLGINVRRFLDTMFPERWIGRGGRRYGQLVHQTKLR